MGIINDQATVQATAVTATVQAMPGTTIPATTTPVTLTGQSEEDSADDLPIAKYLRKFLQQEDVPQQDLTETQHVTEFSQQEVSEPTPLKRPILEEQPIPHQEPPKKDQKLI